MEAEKRPFEAWAVVELMGHHQIAGRVTEEAIAGCNMLRVDVPETGPERPAHTKYFGGGSIYAIHPCTEQLATQAAERLTKQSGQTPLPVAVPDLSEAMVVIRKAEAARAQTQALNPGPKREPWEIDDDDDDDDRPY